MKIFILYIFKLCISDDAIGFSLLAMYKKNWEKANKQLDYEIAFYQETSKLNEKKGSRIFKTSDNVKIDSISVTRPDFLNEQRSSG